MKKILTDTDVILIRKLWARKRRVATSNGIVWKHATSTPKLALRFGVSIASIKKIVQGKRRVDAKPTIVLPIDKWTNY